MDTTMDVLGIDVSVYQGDIDWQKAINAGVKFVIIRCCFGKKLDGNFINNWKNAKKAGLPRGAYGWCLSGQDQKELVNFFWNQIKDDPGELPPAIDFEQYGSKKVGFSELYSFATTLEELCGRPPLIYTSLGYWKSLPNYDKQYWATYYPLWLAQWTTSLNPLVPPPFSNWKIWQFSSDGNGRGKEFGVSSNSVDINRFNGTMDDLALFLNHSAQPIPNNDYDGIVAKLTNISDKLYNLAIDFDKLENWAINIGYKKG